MASLDQNRINQCNTNINNNKTSVEVKFSGTRVQRRSPYENLLFNDMVHILPWHTMVYFHKGPDQNR